MGLYNIMIIKNKFAFFSVFLMALSIAGCTQVKSFVERATNQVVSGESGRGNTVNYPGSVMIYNVCHERWLRNGYANYTFNIEEGVYLPGQEIQRGRFTQTVVSNHRVSQAATCEITYHDKGASCDQGTRKRLTEGRTIEGFFAKWEKNPGLYQACHPVLGYPTGYGHTYGDGNRRIDSSQWLIISSVIPRRASQVAVQPISRIGASHPVVQSAETRKASPVRARKNAQQKKYASVADIDIKLLSSRIERGKTHSTLKSRFDVINPTSMTALLGIKGWIIDKNYKRYPLSVDGKKIKQGKDSQIYTMQVEPHTQTTVFYQADGVPNIPLGKRTAAMLEIMSADGAKVNLTLPNR